MSPDEFISKWQGVTQTERAVSQSHFIDLCRMLDEPAPTDVDPKGEWYCFERGASKVSGGEGWADVWKRGHFGWEYKGKRKDLDAALAQLKIYALGLENPPLLIVCDMERFRIVTNWTATVSQAYEITLDQLRDPKKRQLLKWALSDPERLRPGLTRQALTERAAAGFADLATSLRGDGHDPQAVAHFVNRLVFCMFAEDVDLLPGKMFLRMLDHAIGAPGDFRTHATTLFAAMRTGGSVGFERVKWFNGSLFDDDTALSLTKGQIATIREVARLDWSEIDPSIFGTLFERGLDPAKRGQLGAHYTDREKIMMIVEPVVIRPLLAEWEVFKTRIEDRLSKAAEIEREAKRVRGRAGAAKAGTATKLSNEASAIYREFRDRLRAFRALDPACGSGNFLYLALQALKDIEHRAGLDAETLGLQRALPQVGPEAVKGIEVNPYAAELARVTVWIGEIQWMRRNGYSASENPILRPLDTIECRDAILNQDGTEAAWPAADVIIGNPPFIGSQVMLGVLGEQKVGALRTVFADRLPGGVDFVTYWFEKARAFVAAGHVQRAGLVATQSIRRGASRTVLDRIAKDLAIFDAWSDEPWVVDGAAVRVSLICFAEAAPPNGCRLDGAPVGRVPPDLSASVVDLTRAARLIENLGQCFQGPVKVGPFDVDGTRARVWLMLPANPNGRRNSDVVRPWINGQGITGRPADKWIVDFADMTLEEAAFFEAPFEYARETVKPQRDKNRRMRRRIFWWQHGETVPGLRAALRPLARYIATPRVAKHRLFVWVAPIVLPDSRVNIIARDDDTTFGVLHSRFHETWSLRLGGWHGVGNDPQYTPRLGFETFPFPEGLTPDHQAATYAADPRALAIAEAARRLVEARDRWLNPPELVREEPEVVASYPDRLLPVDSAAAKELKNRTLTTLYNALPAWLSNMHAALDGAVTAAYGWPEDISEDDALARLLALNQERPAVDGGPSPIDEEDVLDDPET